MLRLRPYREGDAACTVAWARALSEEAHFLWCGGRFSYPMTAEAWQTHLADMAAEGNAFLWTALTAEGTPAGYFVLRRIDYAAGSARVSYVLLDPALHGRGLGTEMLRLALVYAFNVLGVDEVTLGVMIHNVPAYRAYLSAGFRFSDTDYEANLFCGEVYGARDMVAYRDGRKQEQGQKPEEMRAFFEARLDGYDAHMLCEVAGCREAYDLLPALLPDGTRTLLDLGCGTGLELAGLFRRFPALAVTGVDMSPGMLAALKDKYPSRALTAVCADYRAFDPGERTFDAAMSAESLHHLTHAEKSVLYRRVVAALRPGGVFVDCDYMVERQADEDFYLAEKAARLADAGMDGVRYDGAAMLHIDTPCCIASEEALLRAAGFTRVERVFRSGDTTVLAAYV